MKTIYLVTGAAGHLGNTIVTMLCEQGKSVRSLVLLGDSNTKKLPQEAQIYYGDITDRSSLESFFAIQPDEQAIVIHTAGIVTIATKFCKNVYDVNVQGTKNIVDFCLAAKVKRLVHVSSVHAIPELTKGEIITEIDSFDPSRVKGLYAKTKAEATQYVLNAAADGLDACVVHPSGICGPNDGGRGHITQLIIDYCNGTLTAGVRGGYDFVDVRDVAQGIISCTENGHSGECYILSNQHFEVSELLNIFSKVSGRPPVKTILPMWFAKSTAALSELYYKLKKQPPLYTAYSLYTLSSNSLFSSEKAKQELGFTNRPFDQTVSDTIVWLEKNGRLKPANSNHKRPRKPSKQIKPSPHLPLAQDLPNKI